MYLVRRPARVPEFELYDHVHDPLDRTDVAILHPEVVERLTKAVNAFRRQAEAQRLKPDSAATEQMSPEQVQRLRALGYIQ